MDKWIKLIILFSKLDTETRIYYSIDTMLQSEEVIHYPTEFLNSLHLPEMSSHRLVLKVDTPIILLGNLNSPNI